MSKIKRRRRSLAYLITFLEGVVSFISPCMLPMLPVYVSYFAGGGKDERPVLPRAAAFVLGFTVVFCLLGLFAGTVGMLLSRYRRAVNIVCGLIVIILGLGYLEIVPLPFFRGASPGGAVGGTAGAFLFGLVYSVSLTPCVGAFLGGALMLASASGTALKGLSLLLAYSLGLGLPFVLSAALLRRLRGVFAAIRAHYRTVNLVCGGFLIAVGVMMALGLLDRVLVIFA